jgi:hypothetical protein
MLTRCTIETFTETEEFHQLSLIEVISQNIRAEETEGQPGMMIGPIKDEGFCIYKTKIDTQSICGVCYTKCVKG